jgi:hydrogenase/urease accessory protein HupE
MKRWSFLLLALCWPGPAFAHSSVPGIQGIYWGMLHPFTSGPQILALFGLALLIQQHIPDAEDVFHSFWAACLVGAGAAFLGPSGFDPEMILTLAAIIAGVLVASAIRLPLLAHLALSICCGLLIGYLSWPDPGGTGDMMLTTLGAIIGAVLAIILVAGGIETLSQATKWPWLPIAVRIAGSWTAAISVLLGALLFRKLS